MPADCCPECGHLLSKHRGMCPFCGWNENFDADSYSLQLENDLSYHDPGPMRPAQQPGF